MKIFIVILCVIIFLFQKLKMFNIINVNNNKCKCNNFYSLELFNNLDLNCIYNYDNIDFQILFLIYIKIKQKILLVITKNQILKK